MFLPLYQPLAIL